MIVAVELEIKAIAKTPEKFRVSTGVVGQNQRSSQVVHQAAAYPGFCGIKRLGVFLLPPGWDASPTQGNPQH